MKRTLLLGSLIAALLAPLTMAQAHSGIAIAVGTPAIGIRIGVPAYPPVPVYAPTPVYVPAPVYLPVPLPAVAPPPQVVYAPVVPAPRVVLAPVYYGRPGAWIGPAPHGHGHWYGQRDGYVEYRRAGYRAASRY